MFPQIFWRAWDFVAVEFSYYSWPAKGRPRPKVPILRGVYMLPQILWRARDLGLQGACRHHKLLNFCARLNHFLGVYGKMKTTIFFVFSCSLSWYTLFFLLMHFSWRKWRNKIAFFRLFSKKSKHVSWKWL